MGSVFKDYMLMNSLRVSRFFVLLAVLPACRTATELALPPDCTVAVHYEYSAFGKVVMAASGVQSDGLPPHLLNPYRFSSECQDDLLGLVCYNYRHYNPVDGRWLRRDSIEEESKND